MFLDDDDDSESFVRYVAKQKKNKIPALFYLTYARICG